jgi:hypothetical protein
MATWKLNRKYPATVISFDPETGHYLVEFYDQVQSSVKPSQVRKMRKDEEVNHLNSNGDMRTGDDGEVSFNNKSVDKAETPDAAQVVSKPVTPKGR